MIGWIGLGLLMIAYIVYMKSEKWFITIDLVATGLLVIHTSIIKDLPTILVNAFIFIILSFKLKDVWSVSKPPRKENDRK